MSTGSVMSHLIVIASYSFPLDANIAKAALSSAGIPAFVADEHTINMQWLYSNAMGGVRVLVAREHESAAITLLTNNFSLAVDAECSSNIETCQNCGSKSIEFHTKGRVPAYFLFIVIGFPLFFHKHGFKCSDCGYFTET